MRRLHLLSLAFVVAAAAFIFAVQRDTFIRRWLVKPRVAPAQKIIPHVRTNGAVSVGDAVAIISDAAGVRIDLDHGALVQPNPASAALTVDIDLDEPSVREALDPVLNLLRSDAVVIPKDGGLLVTTLDRSRTYPSVVVRMYDLGPLITYHNKAASPDEALVKQPETALASVAVPEAGEVEAMIQDHERVYRTWNVRVYSIGQVLVVVAPASVQPEVAELLGRLAAPRGPGSSAPQVPPGPVERRLQQPLPSLDLRGVTLLDAYHRVGQAARLSVLLNYRELSAAGINLHMPVTFDASGMTGGQAFAALDRAASKPRASVRHVVDGGLLRVGQYDEFYGPFEEVAYDVSDLLAREVRRLRASDITETASAPGIMPSLAPSASGLVTRAQKRLIRGVADRMLPAAFLSARFYRGRLIVTAHQASQRRITALLDAFRATDGPLSILSAGEWGALSTPLLSPAKP